jgi:hypothetical protein
VLYSNFISESQKGEWTTSFAAEISQVENWVIHATSIADAVGPKLPED